MNTIECIKSRVSCRAFKADRIPDKLVEEILESAVCAPSAGNVQDWEFIVVVKQETKEKLAEAAWGQDFLRSAPLIIVACSNIRRISAAYGDRGANLYSIQDTSASVENLMLAAWEKGLGSCWVGSFNEEKVREALVLPSRVRPLAIIPIGYPAAKPSKSQRRPIGEVIHREFY
jgi:nitroreductase